MLGFQKLEWYAKNARTLIVAGSLAISEIPFELLESHGELDSVHVHVEVNSGPPMEFIHSASMAT